MDTEASGSKDAQGAKVTLTYLTDFLPFFGYDFLKFIFIVCL